MTVDVDNTNYSVFGKSHCEVNDYTVATDGNLISNVTCVKIFLSVVCFFTTV